MHHTANLQRKGRQTTHSVDVGAAGREKKRSRIRQPDAAETGRRVRAVLDAGRRIAIAKQRAVSAGNDIEVRRALDLDLMNNAPKYGRVKRISRATGIKDCTVRKVLIRLSSRIKSSSSTPGSTSPETS
jgi:hypothetical protein